MAYNEELYVNIPVEIQEKFKDKGYPLSVKEDLEVFFKNRILE